MLFNREIDFCIRFGSSNVILLIVLFFQADVAVMVVNATRGEFEAGFDSGGQTREHAVLVRSLGVNQLLVAVNKLDTVDWSQERFDFIVEKLKHFLKVRKKMVLFIHLYNYQLNLHRSRIIQVVKFIWIFTLNFTILKQFIASNRDKIY